MKEYFVSYALHDQEILNRKESVEKVLALVPEDILFAVSQKNVTNAAKSKEKFYDSLPLVAFIESIERCF